MSISGPVTTQTQTSTTRKKSAFCLLGWRPGRLSFRVWPRCVVSIFVDVRFGKVILERIKGTLLDPPLGSPF